MKKTIMALWLALCLVQASASYSLTRQSWYFCPTSDGSRPEGNKEATYLEKRGGVYLGKDEKTVYLTFDLGYENENVGKILDALKKHEAKGAFFVLQHEVEEGKYLDRIAEEGHLVCNHTCHHPDMTTLQDKEAFCREVETLASLYREKTGREMAPYFRPPQGVFNEQTLVWAEECGYKTVFWSLAYADWDNAHTLREEDALEKLMSRVHNGAVILLHPISDTNGAIMDEFLTRLEKEGYRFGSLEEL